jgi:integrase
MTTKPIEKSKVTEMKKVLKKQSTRNYILFLFGLYTGYRISDILKLKVKDVRNQEYIRTKEIKTKKNREVILNDNFVKELNVYIENMNDESFLFPSRTGKGTKAISRVMAWSIIKDAAKQCGMDHGVSPHSLRKSIARSIYDRYDLAIAMEFLNHSSERMTLKYLGITGETINKAINEIKW